MEEDAYIKWRNDVLRTFKPASVSPIISNTNNVKKLIPIYTAPAPEIEIPISQMVPKTVVPKTNVEEMLTIKLQNGASVTLSKADYERVRQQRILSYSH